MSDRLTSSPLSRLQGKLQLKLETALHPKVWGAPAEMTKALAGVKTQFDSAEVRVNERSIAKALLAFRNSGDLSTFIDLKYACFGLSQRVGRDDWSLIEDAVRFPAFLKRVDKERPQPRRFRKCYQGLMHGYFGYDIFDSASEAAQINWQKLQKYLRDRLNISLAATHTPTWLRTLSDHENLVTSKPCERYAITLMKGDASELAAAAEGIGISPSSWLWQEAMLAHTQAVAKRTDDGEFRTLMGPLIDILDGKGDIELSETIVARCAAQLLIRYTKCKERPEHARLRDLAVNHIGNPWLKRAAWDAYVQNEEARKMVDGWLKRRLITDFFALLSEDGLADERRLNYWLRFEPVVEDMWFALGSQARTNTSQEFREMRMRMEGRLHYLEGMGNTSDNNAFIMRIGSFMVIEFGVTGHACYIFHLSDFKIDFGQRFISIGRLKGTNHVGRLIHRADWEPEFDHWLCPRIGWNPESPPSKATSLRTTAASMQQPRPQPRQGPAVTIRGPFNMADLERFAARYGLKINDLRRKQGALWVLTHNENTDVNRQLIAMGFRYKARKGWWKE